MKPIYDFCIFNNEFEMLDLRLAYMESFVDRFFVCEANVTHQGESKEYHFQRFLNDYPIAQSLVAEGRLRGLSVDLSNVAHTNRVHCFHRVAFSDWVKRNIEEDYVGLLADCDEIVSEDFIEFADAIEGFISLDMKMFYFAADNYSCKQSWDLYVKAFDSRVLESMDFETLRTTRAPKLITEMGWHFSSFGGIAQVQNKIESISHPEFNLPQFKSASILRSRLKNREDYLGRQEYPCTEYSLKDYPDRLSELLSARPQLFSLEEVLSRSGEPPL